MKAFYKLITAQLKTIPAIKWIDFDNGQLDNGTVGLKFPCSLITIKSANEDIDESGSQQKDFTVTLRTAFDASASRTAADTPDSVLSRSLAYTDTVGDIYDAFQGSGLGDYTEFECTAEELEQRSDGVVVFKQVFKTSIMVFK